MWGLRPQPPRIYRVGANPSEISLPLGLSSALAPAWSWPRSRRSACFPAEKFADFDEFADFTPQETCLTGKDYRSRAISPPLHRFRAHEPTAIRYEPNLKDRSLAPASYTYTAGTRSRTAAGRFGSVVNPAASGCRCGPRYSAENYQLCRTPEGACPGGHTRGPTRHC